MPAALENLINLGYADGGQAYGHLISARNALYDAGDSIANQNWAQAKTNLYTSGDEFGYFARYLLQDDVFYESLRGDWKDALYWINDNWPSAADPYELTMQKIIETMWKSNPLETFFYVNYIDGMRASIWNLEIQETHLRDIYTHFLSWD